MKSMLCCIEEKECEELELRGKNLYEAIESESVVALYTPTNVFLLMLCD